jgi:hypothetical protein
MEYEATVRAGLAQRQLRSYNDSIKLATLSAEEPPAMPEQARPELEYSRVPVHLEYPPGLP